IFARSRMEEMVEQFTGLLSQIGSRPGERISAYELVTPEARQVLPDPGDSIDEPEVGTIAGAFLAAAERSPTSVAVVAGDRSWTYSELLRASAGIVRTLLDAGMGVGTVVAVSGRRSFGLIASLLGVLRSRGVLLTLDPALPLTRRKLMMMEARASLFVCDGSKDLDAEALAAHLGKPAIVVSEDGSHPAAAARVLPEPSPRDPAYVFFTSGTSGSPKAVLGSHRGLAHFLKWEREAFGVGPGDRCAQLTGLSFDVVLRDVLLPLTSGASLHLPPGDEDVGSPRTISWLAAQQITILHTVPAIAQSWLAAPPPDARSNSLRLVLFAGEPLTDALVQRWFDAFSRKAQVVNLYGPTETTLAKCFFVVPPTPPAGIQPVGTALPQTQALVLGAAGRLCGIGEVGEIVIRTPFRTLGYMNSPEEQRARFVPNPFRADPADLMYRTGDRGRYRLDGSLGILGRLDDQVKVRGVRVEPAEVASVLSRHPAVRACAVVARKTESGEIALGGYVVTAGKDREISAELRANLTSILPAAMVPSAFVFLDALPLTANGKLDRAALPAPDFSARSGERSVVLPRTPIEEVVASAWSAVLKIETIGVMDNFFELGGHSLKATQAVSRIGQAFGIDLPVRALFESPTVAALSLVVESSLLAELQTSEANEEIGERVTGVQAREKGNG
ncbi:MAG: non-ribosomal peptide synthetase, partial [Acidobacteriota bacterium]